MTDGKEEGTLRSRAGGSTMRLTMFKDGLAATKDLLLIFALAALVAYPKGVVGFLKGRGFTVGEISFFGVSASITNPDSVLGMNQRPLETQQLVATLIDTARPSAADANLQRLITEPLAELRRAEGEALASPAAAAITDWAIVVAATPSLREAGTLVTSLALPEGKVIVAQKRGVFRVVVRAGSVAEVGVFEGAVRQKFPSAYVRRFSTWCGAETQRSGYIVCSAV